jgi:hypothetical protein
MSSKGKEDRKGFTLVEIIVAAGLSFVVIAMIMSSFLALSSASRGTAYYHQMHSDVRHAIDVIGKDIVSSSEIVHIASGTGVVLRVIYPSGTGTVAYIVVGETLKRDASGFGPTTLATGVDDVTFQMYNKEGLSTTNEEDAFFLDVKIEMSQEGVKNTYRDVLQVRHRMRNKGI